MKLGWFSVADFYGPLHRYTGGLPVRRNHCIYSKPNGGYAVITQVAEHTSRMPNGCKLVGEVTECLIDVSSPYSKVDELDQAKLASAAIEVGVSLEELLGKVCKKPPIEITPDLLEKLKSIGAENDS